jgi:hypothetical protein
MRGNDFLQALTADILKSKPLHIYSQQIFRLTFLPGELTFQKFCPQHPRSSALDGEKAAANNSLSFAIMSVASASRKILGSIGVGRQDNGI